MSKLERKLAFIRQLAEFLVGNEANKSIFLEIAGMVDKADVPPSQQSIFLAEEWAALRQFKQGKLKKEPQATKWVKL